MKHFIVKDFTYAYKQPHRATQNLHEIQADPSLKYETFVFAKKKDISFEEVLHIMLTSNSRSDYVGATSLIYFRYYNEFYSFLTQISQSPLELRKRKRALSKFKKVLCRWLDFIKYSDDTLYPQNEVFRKMRDVLINIGI